MIIVTGGAGFIGSNIVRTLNDRGREDIVVVDNLENGVKFRNIADCRIHDYQDKQEFIAKILAGDKFTEPVEAIFHEGACSATTEWDGRYMMRNHYEYSKQLLHYCLDRGIAYLYASSAAVYGGNDIFREDPQFEAPLNVYGYSKLLFDQYVRRILPQANSQVAGFRYFNVYGPREDHKGNMASVAYHFNNQVLADGEARLFAGSDGYADGEQRRDFIYVGDAVDVNLWFLDNPGKSGIFNVGTGRSQTFNDVARSVVDWPGRGELTYIPFPDHLLGRYQSYPEADLTQLRAVGDSNPFQPVAEGVTRYTHVLSTSA